MSRSGKDSPGYSNTARALQRVEAEEEDFDLAEWRRLQRQLGELSGRVAALATKLRLTPQSRYGPRGAATAARGRGDGPKPWEVA